MDGKIARILQFSSLVPMCSHFPWHVLGNMVCTCSGAGESGKAFSMTVAVRGGQCHPWGMWREGQSCECLTVHISKA